MNTNNVMMTENDKRNVENTDLQKQIKKENTNLISLKMWTSYSRNINCQKIIYIWQLKSQVLTQIVSYT